MRDYSKYKFDELAKDSYFHSWVIDKNPDSEAYWQQWTDQNPQCHDNVLMAKSFLLALEEKKTALSHIDLENITESIVANSKTISVPFWRSKVWRVAASVVFLLGLGTWWFSTKTAKNSLGNIHDNYVENTNQSQKIETVRLEDGSEILLYPKSTIRYPKPFAVKQREVQLVGQAFFKIAKNPNKPFWVFTKHISTQVLGTSFMVKAYDETKDAIVEVKTGKVSVYTREDLVNAQKRQENKFTGVVLTPNQQVLFSENDERLVKSVVQNPEQIVKPSANELIFDDTPIVEVFEMLEKMYGIKIIHDASFMKNCYLTATLSDESLYQKLDLICKATRSSYEIVDAQIIVHSVGCQ